MVPIKASMTAIGLPIIASMNERERTRGLEAAGTMPAEPVTADRPDCWLCTWSLVSTAPPLVWHLRFMSASCDVHASVTPARWSYDRYRAGQPSPEPRKRAGYSQPAQFLCEIADQADEKVSVRCR